MKNNISKTRLQVQCLIGSVLPTVFGQKKDIQNRKDNCENLILMSIFSILFYSMNKYCKYLGVQSVLLAIHLGNLHWLYSFK